MEAKLKLQIDILHLLAVAEKTGDYSKVNQGVIDRIESYASTLPKQIQGEAITEEEIQRGVKDYYAGLESVAPVTPSMRKLIESTWSDGAKWHKKESESRLSPTTDAIQGLPTEESAVCEEDALDFLKSYFKQLGFSLDELEPDEIAEVMVAYSCATSPLSRISKDQEGGEKHKT